MRRMRQKMRMCAAMIAVLALLVGMSGCGKEFEVDENGQDASGKDDSLIVVGVSQVGSESVWRTANTASIQRVFSKENGYLLIFDNARQKQENQIKAIQSYISQQVDYIVFSPIVEDGWDTVLNEAKDAGIPVILMDRKVKVSDESLYTTCVGSNFEKEGKDAGRWLAKYLEQEGRQDEIVNIVVLQGTTGATSTYGRTEGFNQIVKTQKNWEILEQTDADFTTAKGKEEMRRMLKEYKDIDVLVSQNDDMTFGAIEAIEEVGKKPGEDIIIVSFDGVMSALEMVKAGKINVDLECNPEQGVHVEKVIRMLENGESVEKSYYVPEKVFTRKNVDNFMDDRTY